MSGHDKRGEGMTREEAEKILDDLATQEEILCKRNDAASGYMRSGDESIRTAYAKICEKKAKEYREIIDIIKTLAQEPCEDVEEALRILDAINTSGRLDYGDYCELFDAISAIQPKQKIGRWERYIVDSGFNANWKCSICGCNVFSDYVSYRFCPSCGAKMWIK